MGWTIKQMSKKTGLSTDSLRYYDKLGIIVPKREENGYRCYDERDHILLQYVTVMKYANFSLSEIKTVIQLMDIEPSEDCNRINRELLHYKREELSEYIRNFKQILKCIDTILPMIENVDVFEHNEIIIDDYVRKIYDRIMKSEKPWRRTI